MEDTNWFARFADVPGVGYVSHPGIDRRTLPQHDAKPEVETFSCDGERRRSLFWRTPTGGTSQSPASAWASQGQPGASTAEVLRRLYEVLELPGTASDYHFALLGAYQILWSQRRRTPEVLPEFEHLCLLDIKLVQKRSDIIRMFPGEQFAASVPAFHYLVSLYSREGFLDEALTIAKLAVDLGQGDTYLKDVETRMAALREEGGS